MELPLAFKTLRITRHHMLRELEGMGHEDMLVVPGGRDDNVLWNVGHLLCSLSRLTYVFSGQPLPIPERYLELFGKGTSATNWTESPDPAEVLERFKALPAQIEADYLAGNFKEYKPLQITPADTIGSVEEAVAFHCFHEGLHIGMIITLKEVLGLATADTRPVVPGSS